jgi:hypothetical protein
MMLYVHLTGSYDDAWVFGLPSIPQSWLLARNTRLDESSPSFNRLTVVLQNAAYMIMKIQQCLNIPVTYLHSLWQFTRPQPSTPKFTLLKNGPTIPIRGFSKNVLHVRLMMLLVQRRNYTELTLASFRELVNFLRSAVQSTVDKFKW